MKRNYYYEVVVYAKEDSFGWCDGLCETKCSTLKDARKGFASSISRCKSSCDNYHEEYMIELLKTIVDDDGEHGDFDLIEKRYVRYDKNNHKAKITKD